MDRDNVWFLKKQFRKLFSAYFKETDNPTDYEYIIDFDPADKGNIDFHLYRRISRGHFKVNMNQSFEETCEELVQSGNIIPLWIKMSLVDDTKTFRLIISKRFHKKKVIEEWHKDNELMPIIYANSGT